MLAWGARPIRITSVRITGVLLCLGFPCPPVTVHQYSIPWTPARYQSAAQAVLVMSIRHFILSLYSPMMGQKSPQHVAVIVLYNVIVNLIQLFAFVCLNCSNFIAVFHLSTIDPGLFIPTGFHDFSLSLPCLLRRISSRHRPSTSFPSI